MNWTMTEHRMRQTLVDTAAAMPAAASSEGSGGASPAGAAAAHRAPPRGSVALPGMLAASLSPTKLKSAAARQAQA